MRAGLLGFHLIGTTRPHEGQNLKSLKRVMRKGLSMNEALVRKYWSLFSDQKWEESKSLLHSEFLAEWPQSRERFKGADAYVDMNREYPGTHRMEVLQLMSVADRVVSTVFIHAHDTGQKTFATSWFDICDGKIAKLTEFWGAPYEAPESRNRWAERY